MPQQKNFSNLKISLDEFDSFSTLADGSADLYTVFIVCFILVQIQLGMSKLKSYIMVMS